MEPYRHILLATDLSDEDEVAAIRAADLMRCWGAELTLLHVIEHFPEDEPNQTISPEDTDPADYLTADARDRLNKLVARLGAENIDRRVVASTGSAKSAILRFAENTDVDLIILASGVHHLMPGLVGSTEGGVLHGATCDVLVVHPTRQ
jgi:universal stress protein A